jgi:hypothetical protein
MISSVKDSKFKVQGSKFKAFYKLSLRYMPFYLSVVVESKAGSPSFPNYLFASTPEGVC